MSAIYTCPRCEEECDHDKSGEAACVGCGVCSSCVPTSGGEGMSEYCSECIPRCECGEAFESDVACAGMLGKTGEAVTIAYVPGYLRGTATAGGAGDPRHPGSCWSTVTVTPECADILEDELGDWFTVPR